MLELSALTLDNALTVLPWRNAAMETLRTPMMLTREQQEEWYRDVICDRRSSTRYWALWAQMGLYSMFVGYGGIENIEWENRRGEISLLIGPDYRGMGYGREAVRLFLDRAFNYLNLETVWGESYMCGHPDFWRRCVEDYNGQSTRLPRRKYYGGSYHDSLYFTFTRCDVGAWAEANGGRV